jgi:ethanolamine utilization protein EutA (predicted chaperonin)
MSDVFGKYTRRITRAITMKMATIKYILLVIDKMFYTKLWSNQTFHFVFHTTEVPHMDWVAFKEDVRSCFKQDQFNFLFDFSDVKVVQVSTIPRLLWEFSSLMRELKPKTERQVIRSAIVTNPTFFTFKLIESIIWMYRNVRPIKVVRTLPEAYDFLG